MNTFTNNQRNSHRFAAAGIAAIAGAGIAIAAGPAAPQQHQLDDQNPTGHQLAWMQPDTRNRDTNRDRDTNKYDDKEHKDDKGKENPYRVEAKAIDMNLVTTARKLLGAEVFSITANDSIGTVTDLIIEIETGDIQWLILDKDGLFEDVVALNMENLTWHRAQHRFTTTITEARLSRMPEFKAEAWAGLRHDDWSAALEDFLIGDERRPMGTIRQVRAKDILGQPLLANIVMPQDPNVDNIDDADGTEIERTEVAEVHDIVLAMDIMRAPILIARTDEFMEDPVDRAVPINAVRWGRDEPILMNMTDELYQAVNRVPENFPAGAREPTDIIHAFRSFKVTPLIKRHGESTSPLDNPQNPGGPRW